MDTAFLLDQDGRHNFLRLVTQSFACTYICLWSYLPNSPKACLIFRDGFYHVTNQPISSSSVALASTLFHQYRRSVIIVENNQIPGVAVHNNIPYIEFQELDLSRRASTEIQKQFYHEAGIKTAAFIGCKSGEIELGWSSRVQNMEMKMRNWCPENLKQQSPLLEIFSGAEQNPISSSSSSLRSLDSPEYTPMLLNTTTSSYNVPVKSISSTSNFRDQQAMQMLTQISNIQLPIETEHDTMARAILAVLSSPSCSSSSSSYQVPHSYRINQKATAFKKYSSASISTIQSQIKNNLGGPSMQNRAIMYFRSLNSLRIQEHSMLVNRPTSTQLHHMISERKRREKLNESFQLLRSLLPAGSKKDKASVLSSSREYLSSLKAEVVELTERNKLLEAQLYRQARESTQDETHSSNNGRLNIVMESMSQEGIINLHVSVTGECDMVDLVINLLEFIKRAATVTLMSMEASTRIEDSAPLNWVLARLKIEVREWDQSAFQEAVRRVLSPFLIN